jgi:hypothetical protein
MRGAKKIDITGKKFGTLTAICVDEETRFKRKSNSLYWLCKCDCGRVKSYRSDVLRKHPPKSCGCASLFIKIDDKIGNLTIVSRVERKNRNIYWNARCACGKKIVVSSHSLKAGRKSCGCLENPSGKRHPSFIGIEDISGTTISRIQKNAETRGIEYNIDKQYIWDLFLSQNKKCALTGMDIKFGQQSRRKEKAREETASLDRIDNSLGYIKGNVQWVHKDINKMKNTHSLEYFKKLCKLVSNKE